jgi:hypothetical protein
VPASGPPAPTHSPPARADKKPRGAFVATRQSAYVILMRLPFFISAILRNHFFCIYLHRMDTTPTTPKPEKRDLIHYLVMSLALFASKHHMSRKDACNYLVRFKGFSFVIDNYEVEHQLSLQDCVDDMTAICKRNGGYIG